MFNLPYLIGRCLTDACDRASHALKRPENFASSKAFTAEANTMHARMMIPSFVAICAIAVTYAPAIFAACNTTWGEHNNTTTYIRLIPDNDLWEATGLAAQAWTAKCLGRGMPSFWLSRNEPTGSFRNLAITRVAGKSPDPGVCGKCCSGGVITVYATYDKPEGGTGFCNTALALDDIIGHELGHYLGLGDDTSAACETSIMAPANNRNHVVTDANCATAAMMNTTPAESGDTGGGPGGDPTNTMGDPSNQQGPDYSPIVIDLSGNRFAFTDAAHGVEFDIDADGVAERIGWTLGSSEEAFLVLDRNENGVIDNGAELFGTATPQPASAQPNGYEALKVYDENADGVIDSQDAIYPRLYLWQDSSHDGIAEVGELLSLEAARVRSIGVVYHESRRRDEHGNELMYTGRVDVELRGLVRKVPSVDVFFVSE